MCELGRKEELGAGYFKDSYRLIAVCGLYCGACPKYIGRKCGGCMSGDARNWCKVKSCCLHHGKKNCADCVEYQDLTECPVLNSKLAQAVNFLKRSNPIKSLNRIREIGPEQYALEMSAAEQWTIR